MSPRVALVHDWLTGLRGGEKVLEALAELYPEAPVYTLLHVPGSAGPVLESRSIHTSFLQKIPGIARRYRHFLPLFPAAIEDFDLTGYDLVLSTSHCVAKGAIPGPQAVHLCYCHTPMRYAWDQEHVYFPRRRGLVARLRNLALTALRAWDVAAVPRVDGFMANSRFVARRIGRYYGRDAEVVPPPVDVERFAEIEFKEEGHGMNRSPYALMVSALAPYKRVDLAIAACERLGLELRVVGDGPERARLERLKGERTRLLGRVDDGELERLYAGASFFIQPGVEDFGIAAVEALASGTPVVARGEGGVLDIVDDGIHGVLYEMPSRGSGEDAEEAARLGAAIDKARRIRFNHQVLARRAQTFSTARVHDRVHSFVSRYMPSRPSRSGPHPEVAHR